MAKSGPKGPWIKMTDKDFEKVVAMCRINCTREEVCSVLGYSHDTLNRRLAERGEKDFASLYKKYSGQGKVSLRRMQFKSAEAGNVTMQIWLGKQWLGQVDKAVHDTGTEVADAIREVANNLPR